MELSEVTTAVTQKYDIPVAHVDDKESVAAVIALLQALHGPDYEFAIGHWQGETPLKPQSERVVYHFIMTAQGATVTLQAGDRIRGPAAGGPYRILDEPWAEVTRAHGQALWPGDVVTVDEGSGDGVLLAGEGTYFQVVTGATPYRLPRLAMLRHLPDHPGGCAAYPGAFRRETLPPERPEPGASDQRGTNRVNEHTLDMRSDRTPRPIRHYHGPVSCGPGRLANHSETALVLPRSAYGLPEVGGREEGHLILYRQPAEDPSDRVVVPVRPGSIVVTPATPTTVMGHRFENAFAMLVAIPGFVAPYRIIGETPSSN